MQPGSAVAGLFGPDMLPVKSIGWYHRLRMPARLDAEIVASLSLMLKYVGDLFTDKLLLIELNLDLALVSLRNKLLWRPELD